jgi:hypothetical protein
LLNWIYKLVDKAASRRKPSKDYQTEHQKWRDKYHKAVLEGQNAAIVTEKLVEKV